MPTLVLDNSLATTTANSYADAAYADGYWAQHYSAVKASQWAALSGPQKDALLIQACSILETARFTTDVYLPGDYQYRYDRRTRNVQLLNYSTVPIKFYYYQNLQFPRSIDRDVTSGDLYIPERVKQAQCEQAIYLMNFDETAIATRLQGVSNDSVRVGGIHLTQQYVQNGSAYSPIAMEFLRPYMIRSGNQMRRA